METEIHKNKTLNKAKQAKKDEFYTMMSTIEKEVHHYKAEFKDKTVICCCDDPFESNFFKYFALNFKAFGLKRLICTSYFASSIVGESIPLEDIEGLDLMGKKTRPYKIDISKEDIDSLEHGTYADPYLIRSNYRGVVSCLRGDGDYYSPEVRALIRESDIVVTNPPCSKHTEFLHLLLRMQKDFLVLGKVNWLKSSIVYRGLLDGTIREGLSIRSGEVKFHIPSSYDTTGDNSWRNDATHRRAIDEDYNSSYAGVSANRWFTTFKHDYYPEPLLLYETYSKDKYPHYLNYDAIECRTVKCIPKDYDGVIGVPVTFLDKYNPNQFEIIGNSDMKDTVENLRINRQSYTTKCPIIPVSNGIKETFARIFIRRK